MCLVTLDHVGPSGPTFAAFATRASRKGWTQQRTLRAWTFVQARRARAAQKRTLH